MSPCVYPAPGLLTTAAVITPAEAVVSTVNPPPEPPLVGTFVELTYEVPPEIIDTAEPAIPKLLVGVASVGGVLNVIVELFVNSSITPVS